MAASNVFYVFLNIQNPKAMNHKICLITGANAGIGRATAEELARQGFHIVMVCRSREKGELAQKELIADTNNQAIDLLIADLSSMQQVRELAAQVEQQYDRLDVLINNAAAVYDNFELTEDGIERQFAVNHVAPFLLTNLLLPLIKNTAAARIVNVASNAHYGGNLKFGDLYFKKRYIGFRMYQRTKLCNILFTYELHRRLREEGHQQIAVNCLHPGVVDTDIGGKHTKGIMRFGWRLLKLFGRAIPTDKGAATSVFLASSAAIEGISGKYFDDCKMKTSSKLSHNPQLAKALWVKSAELSGLFTPV